MALSLAKCLLAVWWWSVRVQGQDICPPTPTVLNIGQFMMWDEMKGEVDNSLWVEAYSHTLQRVREAIHGWHWQWPKGKVWEVAVSPLVRVFWDEAGIEPTASCTRLCWESPLRGVLRRRRERGAILYDITFLDDVAVCIPMLDAWDQFIWPPSAAVPQAAMLVEQYGYCRRNAIDLGVVMPTMEFRVTDEVGAYLGVARTLIFKGSVLVYDPTRDEVEWVPTHGVTNDLSWAEERMAVALANFVPCTPQEVDCIMELRTRCLLAWTNDSFLEEEGKRTQEEGKQTQEEGDEDKHKEVEGSRELNPEVPSSDEMHKLGEAEPQQ